MRLAYLYSRYPVLSQTFCDTEMLELERRGFELFVGSVHPPLTTMRHAHALRLRAPIQYAPPGPILQVWESQAKAKGIWPEKLIDAHLRKYGDDFKSALRARNACYFADLFAQEGIRHFHVHFANRAAHTALFLKEISGITFSITAHGEDFMTDLGSAGLLKEICDAAEFVAVETDFSRRMLAQLCPDAAPKIHRVYNGMALDNFPETGAPAYSGEPVKILSVGRLVEFKGFTHLLTACAELKNRGQVFNCEIIGDGPLRDSLQAQIVEQELGSHVTLSGALPQQTVLEKLRSCDIFALASTIDQAGASDVFPTVILEAMASSRPVISTEIAGIPEAVAHGTTGLLVPAGDSTALANAIQTLAWDQWLRFSFGAAGRARVEEHFKVETTIEPLIELLGEITNPNEPSTQLRPAPTSEEKHVGYLIDKWPDPALPNLEFEILELAKRHVPITGFVCELNSELRLTPEMEKLARRLIFLPDPIAIEAAWQANRALGYELEDARANQQYRVPPTMFLQQARYAVALSAAVIDQKLSHVHATSSRALVCAVMLKQLARVTVSATIEPDPKMPLRALRVALAECEGGRVSDPNLKAHLNDAFLLEPYSASRLMRTARLGLSTHSKVWKEWSDLLLRWR